MKKSHLEERHSLSLKPLAKSAVEDTDAFVHTLRELRTVLFQEQFDPSEILDFLLLEYFDAKSEEDRNTAMARYAIMQMLLDATRYASSLDNPDSFSWEEFFNQWGVKSES